MEFLQAAAGRPTTLAVRDAIAAAKGDSALRPVRVIVSSNLAGLSLRRVLGSLKDDAREARAGIANVNFSTPFQYASLLAAPSLAAEGLRPLTTSVLAAAVRHVLSVDPGRFGSVATHVATETALIRAYGEIIEMPPAQRAALANSANTRTRDLLRFVAAVDTHLNSGTGTSYHDEYTVLRTAIDVANSGEGPAELADRLVLVGPFTQGVATLESLRDLVACPLPNGEQRDPIAVWSVTGDADVDAAAHRQATSIFGSVPPVDAAIDIATPTALVPAADSDEEAREVVRSILSAADSGVRFDRMAVFVPAAAPYLRTLREQLDGANIPSAGPEYRTLADSMTGRLVTSLLNLAEASTGRSTDKAFSRETVMALVSAAPLRGPNGKALRSGPWENISRKAGVVSGLDGWAEALSVHADSIQQRIEENPESSEGFIATLRREQRAAGEMAAFVAWLGSLTSSEAIGTSWNDRANWIRSSVAALLPEEHKRTAWPESEVEAAQRIDKILSRVGVLDEVEPNVTASSFVRAVNLELDVPAGRRGRFGTGVLVAPLSSAVGLDLEVVFILGMAEGVCPRPIREDTLIPDDERKLTGGGLATRADENRQERLRYLHAVASGAESATLVSPMGDHREGHERTASRWWVEAMRSKALEEGFQRSDGEQITSHNWKEATSLFGQRRGSFQESLNRAVEEGLVTSASDLQLHQVHARTSLGATVADEALAAPLQRALASTDERLTGFNRFTGDLGGADVTSPTSAGKAVSPTLLETWAHCPRKYFLGRVLGLGEIDRPEAIAEMSALDRGSLVHAIMEDFIRDSLPSSNHALTHPDQPWTEADRERLFAFADTRFQEYEDLNRTGKPILWSIQKEVILADLATFLRRDEELRAEKQMAPSKVEMPFGMGDRFDYSVPAAMVELPDGRTLALRGFIDRVDERVRDGVPVVLDYKTGKAAKQNDFDEDPVLGGSKLQLGAYAFAAKQAFEAESAYAYYWYTTNNGDFAKAGYHWGDEQEERFLSAVTTIVDGIEQGMFPPNPGEYNSYYGTYENCKWCEFKRLCPVDRGSEFEQAVESGRLVEFLAMVDPAIDDEAEEA